MGLQVLVALNNVVVRFLGQQREPHLPAGQRRFTYRFDRFLTRLNC